jgi:hypothetical protein
LTAEISDEQGPKIVLSTRIPQSTKIAALKFDDGL